MCVCVCFAFMLGLDVFHSFCNTDCFVTPEIVQGSMTLQEVLLTFQTDPKFLSRERHDSRTRVPINLLQVWSMGAFAFACVPSLCVPWPCPSAPVPPGCLSPVQEKLQLEKFVDVRGEDFKSYCIQRLNTLAMDDQMWRYSWCVSVAVSCRVCGCAFLLCISQHW